MTDLFDPKYQPGRILIKTVGSGGPSNSWVSALAISQIGKQVDIWYSPDLTTIYDEDECNETHQLGSIEGELDFRKLVSWLSLNKPEDFYFDEITIEGVKGVWEDLIVISLYEEYEETLDHILSLNDQELEVFWQKSGPFAINGDADTEFLERINFLFDVDIDEADRSGATLAELLTDPEVEDPLSLDSLDKTVQKWITGDEENFLEDRSEESPTNLIKGRYYLTNKKRCFYKSTKDDGIYYSRLGDVFLRLNPLRKDDLGGWDGPPVAFTKRSN